jgi:hypothetical protein
MPQILGVKFRPAHQRSSDGDLCVPAPAFRMMLAGRPAALREVN